MKLIKMTVTTEWADEATGEIIKDVRELKDETIKKPRATKSTSSKIDERTEPILTLQDNKYTLSKGAVEVLGVTEGDKIDIKFQKVDKTMIPVIGSNEVFGTKAGNKLTKSNTVSYRGKANEELSVYGAEFKLEAHPSADGLFVLKGENTPDVAVPVAKPDAEDDIDLDDFEDVEDTTEIKSEKMDFTL